jgi:hypothetical protein
MVQISGVWGPSIDVPWEISAQPIERQSLNLRETSSA